VNTSTEGVKDDHRDKQLAMHSTIENGADNGGMANGPFSASQKWAIVLGVAIWIGLICCGFHFLFAYQTRPGSSGAVTTDWPPNSVITPSGSGWTLVMFAHPQCPCTHASVTELSQIMSRCQNLTGYVVFLHPTGFAANWEKTSLWNQASNIPNVHVLTDQAGSLAAKFGVVTSGHTLLYDSRGKLVFSGGITPGRAHEGDNAGVDSIVAAVTATVPKNQIQIANKRTAVFGCSLLDGIPNSDLLSACKVPHGGSR
jgi:hypothetical protein